MLRLTKASHPERQRGVADMRHGRILRGYGEVLRLTKVARAERDRQFARPRAGDATAIVEDPALGNDVGALWSMWEHRPLTTVIPTVKDEPHNPQIASPDAKKQKPRASGAFEVAGGLGFEPR